MSSSDPTGTSSPRAEGSSRPNAGDGRLDRCDDCLSSPRPAHPRRRHPPGCSRDTGDAGQPPTPRRRPRERPAQGRRPHHGPRPVAEPCGGGAEPRPAVPPGRGRERPAVRKRLLPPDRRSSQPVRHTTRRTAARARRHLPTIPDGRRRARRTTAGARPSTSATRGGTSTSRRPAIGSSSPTPHGSAGTIPAGPSPGRSAPSPGTGSGSATVVRRAPTRSAPTWSRSAGRRRAGLRRRWGPRQRAPRAGRSCPAVMPVRCR